ncbi:hypothetical protein FGG08_005876 [Glutinoglossum americanum]|uniref:Uncharacterized protein n=1 Tax=Glutinoglossum americanum TaxID=1670608 RepID=A0A9P8HXC0_9PEZI|nr:hypothetical protein FGG08_005876 [Glutinoglossum americanum]
MAPLTAPTSSCHSPPELALSKLASHLSLASGSQHDVGATRIGRRKAPAQFPFRSSTSATSIDDDSAWGLVLQQSLTPSVGITTYEVSWEAATSISSGSSSCCQTGEFSSLYSPESITKECHLSTTPSSQLRHATTPPDPVPNPLCPEDHACIPVSWRGENRGKGVAVGDGSVRLLERNGTGNRSLGRPVDRLQIGVILPTISYEDRGDAGECEKIRLKREFPGREFRNNLGDGQELDNGTDEVFWKKSTTRKPAPSAAWDWDRMSSQIFSDNEPSPNNEVSCGTRDDLGDHFRALGGPTIGRPIMGASGHQTKALPSENDSIALENLSSITSIAGRRQDKAIRRLKTVIGHFTGAISLSDLDQQQMEQAWDVSNKDH